MIAKIVEQEKNEKKNEAYCDHLTLLSRSMELQIISLQDFKKVTLVQTLFWSRSLGDWKLKIVFRV